MIDGYQWWYEQPLQFSCGAFQVALTLSCHQPVFRPEPGITAEQKEARLVQELSYKTSCFTIRGNTDMLLESQTLKAGCLSLVRELLTLSACTFMPTSALYLVRAWLVCEEAANLHSWRPNHLDERRRTHLNMVQLFRVCYPWLNLTGLTANVVFCPLCFTSVTCDTAEFHRAEASAPVHVKLSSACGFKAPEGSNRRLRGFLFLVTLFRIHRGGWTQTSPLEHQELGKVDSLGCRHVAAGERILKGGWGLADRSRTAGLTQWQLGKGIGGGGPLGGRWMDTIRSESWGFGNKVSFRGEEVSKKWTDCTKELMLGEASPCHAARHPPPNHHTFNKWQMTKHCGNKVTKADVHIDPWFLTVMKYDSDQTCLSRSCGQH